MNRPGKIIVITAHYECRMCPTVVSGRTDDGATIYARYRWGRLVIRLDHGNPPTLGGAAGRWIYDKQIDPEALAGCLSYDELREITAEVIAWPDEIMPKPSDGNDETTWLNFQD